MKVAFFSTHNFEREFFKACNASYQFELTFFEPALNQQTAPLAQGFECVCCFVSDHLDSITLQNLCDVRNTQQRYLS